MSKIELEEKLDKNIVKVTYELPDNMEVQWELYSNVANFKSVEELNVTTTKSDVVTLKDLLSIENLEVFVDGNQVINKMIPQQIERYKWIQIGYNLIVSNMANAYWGIEKNEKGKSENSSTSTEQKEQ